ncbi:hypothetical protein [Streptomyces hydrogenans]|uniref:hypothetical protein n=1 Tax=Streptomyces hydrogenans TaxID=1873719 RepID=UPI00343987B3
MITHPENPARDVNPSAVLRYALIPVTGYGIAVATVTRMLDDGAGGGRARVLAAAEAIPYGAHPVLLAETTVYGARQVEETLMRWGSLPRPWLVWISDAPARPVADARYLVRALEGRLAGVVRVPYLPVLRAVKDADEAMEHKSVLAAAERLRHTMEGSR